MVELNPDRLRLAREIREYGTTELSLAAGVSAGAISQYEHGRSRPRSLTLLRIAKVLQFPMEFFTCDEPVAFLNAEDCFYRAITKTPVRARRRVQAMATLFDRVVDLLEALVELPAPVLPPRLSCGPADAAVYMRDFWELGTEPIEDVVELLESHGLFVRLLSDTIDTIDAHSYWRGPDRAYVVLNPAKGDAYRSRFDACHELGHLVMHSSACSNGSLEGEANAFAGRFLVPDEPWADEAPRGRGTADPNAYLPHKKRWKVSAAALIRRSFDTGVLSAASYRTAMIRYSMLGWRRGEPNMRREPHERSWGIEDVLDEQDIRLADFRDQVHERLMIPRDVALELLPEPR